MHVHRHQVENVLDVGPDAGVERDDSSDHRRHADDPVDAEQVVELSGHDPRVREPNGGAGGIGDLDVVVGRDVELAETGDALLEHRVVGDVAVVLQLALGVVHGDDAAGAGIEKERIGGEEQSAVAGPERGPFAAAGELLEELERDDRLVEGQIVFEAHVDPGAGGGAQRKGDCENDQERLRSARPPVHCPVPLSILQRRRVGRSGSMKNGVGGS